MPRACLKKEKTTANLVKDVMRMRMAGARVRIVIIKTIWSKAETSPGSSPFSIPIRNEGNEKSAAKVFVVKKVQMPKITTNRNKIFRPLTFLGLIVILALMGFLFFILCRSDFGQKVYVPRRNA